MQLAEDVVLIIFGSICCRPSYYYVPGIRAVSSLQDNIIFVFCEPIEVKVGLLFENVLTGYTVTESKCSRVT